MSLTFIYFILILGVNVMIHEVGHLITAKMFNVYCKEFAIGMGPKLFSWKGKETTYSLRAFPFGGYVAMAGEEGVDVDIPHERTIKGIKHWQKIIVMLAGISMNVVLAVFIIVGLYIWQGQITVAPQPIIDGIVENSPAQAAGFQKGDRIVKIAFSDGSDLEPQDFYEVITYMQMYTDASTFTLERSGALIDITVTPRYLEDEKRYMVGLMIPPPTIQKINVIEAVGYGLVDVKDSLSTMVFAIGRMLRGIGLESVSGPIGIYQVTEQQASLGIANLFYLTAVISLNLAIFNLLPLPVMDGGRVVLIIYEVIARKPINEKVEQALMAVSVSLLILLMVLVTWQDILRLF